jgi:hypothetical protein
MIGKISVDLGESTISPEVNKKLMQEAAEKRDR